MTDHHLTPSDRPLPTRLGLCDQIPGTGAPLKARIKRGAFVGHDFHFFYWPSTNNAEPVDPEMIFDAAWTGRYWDCRADGFGRCLGETGGYGNGSIFVFDRDGVLPVASLNRRRTLIEGIRQPWTDDERQLFLNTAHDAAQAGRFEP